MPGGGRRVGEGSIGTGASHEFRQLRGVKSLDVPAHCPDLPSRLGFYGSGLWIPTVKQDEQEGRPRISRYPGPGLPTAADNPLAAGKENLRLTFGCPGLRALRNGYVIGLDIGGDPSHGNGRRWTGAGFVGAHGLDRCGGGIPDCLRLNMPHPAWASQP